MIGRPRCLVNACPRSRSKHDKEAVHLSECSMENSWFLGGFRINVENLLDFGQWVYLIFH